MFTIGEDIAGAREFLWTQAVNVSRIWYRNNLVDFHDVAADASNARISLVVYENIASVIGSICKGHMRMMGIAVEWDSTFGPIFGCVIGFLLKLKARTTLLVVLTGTLLAIIGWAFFLHGLHEKIAAYNPYAAVVGVFIIIAVIIVAQLLHRTLKKRNNQ